MGTKKNPYLKKLSSKSDCEQFLFMKLTQNPLYDYYCFLKRSFLFFYYPQVLSEVLG